ncbi:thioesterase II family protein [Streptomyces sp. NPDC091272]|uniref:thioesterase II family protein n=1 Tax=Streptomyces sp. NPDC091272 TaxID=3365981 RepID=UPI00381A9F8F
MTGAVPDARAPARDLGGSMVWTQCVEARPFAAERVVCFPHAGGSPYFFRSWAKALDRFEVHAVCYPGRAERIAEPPATELVAMARLIADELRPFVAERPTALFGHSMGAAVAYEVARALEADGAAVGHLFASGARAPQLMRADPAAGTTWSDESVAATLVELGQTDAELLQNPAFMQLVMPYIAADFRMLAAYGGDVDRPLSCPVTALVGASDPRVSVEQTAAWQRSTRGPFRLRTLPGDHFYLAADPPFALIDEAVRGR